MAFIEIDESNFQDILKEEFAKKQIVILKFGSDLCDACMALDWELETVDDKYDNVSVLSVNCGDAQELAEHYRINKVPTMIIYEDEDTTLWHKEGTMLSQDIEKIINS